MALNQTQKTFAYILLILVGYGVGQYPFIPSFTFMNYCHVQPSIDVFDKCISITLLAFSLGLLFALWHNFWVMLIMLFITWGMMNNVVDEFTGQAGLLGLSEKLSLLFALLTTSILIWKRTRKYHTK